MKTSDYIQQINDGLMAEMLKHKDALPPGFNRERFALNCVTMIQDMLKDKKKRAGLDGIAVETIVTTFVKGAYLGLDFFNGECYAIPYGGSMQFQTDYKGEIKLCKKYSKNRIKDIFAKVVREGDDFFEEVDTGVQKIYFKPKPFSNAEMIGAFAVATFADGSMIYDTMSKEEIENVRNTYSRAKDSKAWVSSTGEMYKKTVLRRLCKLIDLDFDNIEQRIAYDAGGDAQFLGLEDNRVAALPEKEKPIDVTAQIREANRKATRKKEPVPVPVAEPPKAPERTVEEEYAQFEQEYADFDIPEDAVDNLPFT